MARILTKRWHTLVDRREANPRPPELAGKAGWGVLFFARAGDDLTALSYHETIGCFKSFSLRFARLMRRWLRAGAGWVLRDAAFLSPLAGLGVMRGAGDPRLAPRAIFCRRCRGWG